MNKAQTLLDLFSTQSLQISLPLFVANLLLSALLAWILGRVYMKFGTTLSNREQFARTFLLVTTDRGHACWRTRNEVATSTSK